MKKRLSWALAILVLMIFGQASQSGPPTHAAVRMPARPGPAGIPGTVPMIPLGQIARPHAVTPGSEVKAASDYGRMALYFVPNEGQVDSRVAYYVNGRDKSIYFRPDGLTFILNEPIQREHRRPRQLVEPERRASSKRQGRSWAVGLDFVGAREGLRPQGRDKTDGIVSYFRGRPEEWKTGLPTYARLEYPDLWP